MDNLIIGNFGIYLVIFMFFMLAAILFVYLKPILTVECPPEIRSLDDKIEFYLRVCWIEAQQSSEACLQDKHIRYLAEAAIQKREDERRRKRIEAEGLRQQSA